MINRLCLIMFMILYGVGAQDRCTTPQKKTGVCIDIRECQPLVKILKKRPISVESINYLISFHCGFNGNYSKVCCEAQNPVMTEINESNSSVISEPPNVTNHPNLSLLNHDLCGPITEQKIFGGNKTGIFDYPWMALLFYDTGNLIPEFRCGGSLINKRYVLTAAHCVTSLPSELRLIGVRLGEHDFRTERDCEKEADEFEVVCAEKYQDFGIERTHFHPEFSRGKLQNDIALVRLNNDADFRPQNVRPICMPIGSAAILSQKKVTVTGWGTTELGLRSQELLQVHLSLVNTEKCAQIYNERKTQIWYKQICAGGKNGMDSCSGDSGGPLQAPGMYNNNLKYIQYGLVSFGPTKCGLEGVPAVYTNLVYYMDWILNTISA